VHLTLFAAHPQVEGNEKFTLEADTLKTALFAAALSAWGGQLTP